MKMLVLCLLFFKLLYFPSPIFGSEVKGEAGNELGTKAIAIGFRVFAKSYIYILKIDKLKSDLTAKINKMDENGFHRWYMDLYEHVQHVSYVNKSLGLYEGLNKQEAISILKTMDKLKLYAVVDALPDVLIANEFNRYLFRNFKPLPGSCENKSFAVSVQCMMEAIKKKYCGI